jgi:uncharacterized protein (DUF2062 family)
LTGALEMGDRNSGFLKLLLRLNCCKFFMLWTPFMDGMIIEAVVYNPVVYFLFLRN